MRVDVVTNIEDSASLPPVAFVFDAVLRGCSLCVLSGGRHGTCDGESAEQTGACIWKDEMNADVGEGDSFRETVLGKREGSRPIL